MYVCIYAAYVCMYLWIYLVVICVAKTVRRAARFVCSDRAAEGCIAMACFYFWWALCGFSVSVRLRLVESLQYVKFQKKKDFLRTPAFDFWIERTMTSLPAALYSVFTKSLSSQCILTSIFIFLGAWGIACLQVVLLDWSTTNKIRSIATCKIIEFYNDFQRLIWTPSERFPL
jgi:hypothetical protein